MVDRVKGSDGHFGLIRNVCQVWRHVMMAGSWLHRQRRHWRHRTESNQSRYCTPIYGNQCKNLYSSYDGTTIYV